METMVYFTYYACQNNRLCESVYIMHYGPDSSRNIIIKHLTEKKLDKYLCTHGVAILNYAVDRM